jgi:hypothetical protein
MLSLEAIGEVRVASRQIRRDKTGGGRGAGSERQTDQPSASRATSGVEPSASLSPSGSAVGARSTPSSIARAPGAVVLGPEDFLEAEAPIPGGSGSPL